MIISPAPSSPASAPILSSPTRTDDLKTLRNVKMVMARGHLIREPKVKKYENVERELDKFL